MLSPGFGTAAMVYSNLSTALRSDPVNRPNFHVSNTKLILLQMITVRNPVFAGVACIHFRTSTVGLFVGKTCHEGSEMPTAPQVVGIKQTSGNPQIDGPGRILDFETVILRHFKRFLGFLQYPPRGLFRIVRLVSTSALRVNRFFREIGGILSVRFGSVVRVWIGPHYGVQSFESRYAVSCIFDNKAKSEAGMLRIRRINVFDFNDGNGKPWSLAHVHDPPLLPINTPLKESDERNHGGQDNRYSFRPIGSFAVWIAPPLLDVSQVSNRHTIALYAVGSLLVIFGILGVWFGLGMIEDLFVPGAILGAAGIALVVSGAWVIARWCN
jgi:hypothetical protein